MGKTALVVDDCDISRMITRQVLLSAGYRVLEAGDGNAALGVIEGQSIDLLVSDFHMPGMDGIGLVKAMRAMSAYCTIPMFILSSNANEATRQEGHAAGATAWLSKPLHPSQMLSLIGETARSE